MPWKDPAKIRAYKKRWYAARREHASTYAREYHRAHAEHLNTLQRQRAKAPETKAKRAAYARAYRTRPHAKAAMQQGQKIYTTTNAETIRAKRLAYYRANAERIAARNRAYRTTRLDADREAHRRWRQANREKRKAAAARRRARKRAACRVDLTATEWQTILEAFDYQCAYCPYYKPNCSWCHRRAHALTKDHVTPLVRHGAHTRWNIVPACQSCNAKKGTGSPPGPVQPLLI